MIDPVAETQKWKLSSAWTRVVIFEDRAEMPIDVFDSLHEYSSSLPSGTFVGKRWKCRYGENRTWLMGEYIDDPNPEQIGIIWRRIYFGSNLPATDENITKIRVAAKTAEALAP